MVERLPPEVEAKYTKYLKLRETLATVVREKAVIEANLAEVESVLRAVNELPDDTSLFKMLGYVVVKTTKDNVVKELEEKKEDLEIKLKVLKEQEESLRRELERLEAEIKKLLSGAGGKGGIAGGGA